MRGINEGLGTPRLSDGRVYKGCVSPSSQLLAISGPSVSDTGIGISPDRQRRLCQAFEQVDSSATRRHGGTGLGLAISKQLVEMMGGVIGLDSTLGSGSTVWFNIELPPVIASRPEGLRPSHHATPVPRPGPRLAARGPRLLVAEDNPVNQLVTKRMLGKLGYRADVVADGSEALDALMRADYAAVLMDCQMPTLDGFDATREIRRRQRPPRHTPVIAVTASATQSDRERCPPPAWTTTSASQLRWRSYASCSPGGSRRPRPIGRQRRPPSSGSRRRCLPLRLRAPHLGGR
jgi:CheY-like chemotaxis protein